MLSSVGGRRGDAPMPQWSLQDVSLVRPHLVPRCVDGKYWMLYHVYFEQLLDDFGWFHSQSEAEAKIAEIQRITRPARVVFLSLSSDAVN